MEERSIFSTITDLFTTKPCKHCELVNAQYENVDHIKKKCNHSEQQHDEVEQILEVMNLHKQVFNNKKITLDLRTLRHLRNDVVKVQCEVSFAGQEKGGFDRGFVGNALCLVSIYHGQVFVDYRNVHIHALANTIDEHITPEQLHVHEWQGVYDPRNFNLHATLEGSHNLTLHPFLTKCPIPGVEFVVMVTYV